jgi:predicted component of type VI protein secretion system
MGDGVDFKEIEQGYAETVKERPNYYQQLAERCGALRESISRFARVVSDCFQSYEAPLKPLESRIAELESVAAHFGAVGGVAGTDISQSAEGGVGGASSAVASGTEGLSSREDVVRMLQKIVQFYQRTEPTSPVPLMLERAQRVAMMDFKEIVKEFNLSGNPSIQDVLGWREDP